MKNQQYTVEFINKVDPKTVSKNLTQAAVELIKQGKIDLKRSDING